VTTDELPIDRLPAPTGVVVAEFDGQNTPGPPQGIWMLAPAAQTYPAGQLYFAPPVQYEPSSQIAWPFEASE
jgi:hypothetical protein